MRICFDGVYSEDEIKEIREWLRISRKRWVDLVEGDKSWIDKAQKFYESCHNKLNESG